MEKDGEDSFLEMMKAYVSRKARFVHYEIIDEIFFLYDVINDIRVLFSIHMTGIGKMTTTIMKRKKR